MTINKYKKEYFFLFKNYIYVYITLLIKILNNNLLFFFLYLINNQY